MNQGIYSLSATMVNQLNRVDTLSNNIANVNTTAFKQDNLTEGSFNYYLTQLQQKDIQVDDPNLLKANSVFNTIPKIDGDYIKADLGSVVQTGNKLDFAINEEDKFFKLQDDKGDILLTRSGSFKNMDGWLVTADNYKILDNENNPIRIADGFEEQISLVKTDYTNLDKRGDNNYIINDKTKLENIPSNQGLILQGAIEKSNVNMITSMVALIDSQRRIEQAQKAITGIDDINGKLIAQIGNK